MAKEVSESRRSIREGIEKRKQEGDDRARRMGLVVGDKKTVADTSRKLRLGTTIEGVKAIVRTIDQASAVIDKAFGKESHDLEAIVQKTKKAEQHMDHQTADAQHDARSAAKAGRQIHESREAQYSLTQAKEGAVADARYVLQEQKRSMDNRKRIEQWRKKQKLQLLSTSPFWPKSYGPAVASKKYNITDSSRSTSEGISFDKMQDHLSLNKPREIPDKESKSKGYIGGPAEYEVRKQPKYKGDQGDQYET